jgi:hypothetical protein
MMQAQRLRRLALHVLLAWLLALGAGVVNACVVQSGIHNPGHPAAHGDPHAVKPQAHVQAHDAAAHGHESHPDTPPCERCCDDPSALPQAAKQPNQPLSGFWLASAPIPSFIFQALSEVDGALDSSSVRWRATIPISIAFLRLTL